MLLNQKKYFPNVCIGTSEEVAIRRQALTSELHFLFYSFRLSDVSTMPILYIIELPKSGIQHEARYTKMSDFNTMIKNINFF